MTTMGLFTAEFYYIWQDQWNSHVHSNTITVCLLLDATLTILFHSSEILPSFLVFTSHKMPQFTSKEWNFKLTESVYLVLLQPQLLPYFHDLHLLAADLDVLQCYLLSLSATTKLKIKEKMRNLPTQFINFFHKNKHFGFVF